MNFKQASTLEVYGLVLRAGCEMIGSNEFEQRFTYFQAQKREVAIKHHLQRRISDTWVGNVLTLA